MRLLLRRTEQPLVELPPVDDLSTRYEVKQVADRHDLSCVSCHRTFAHGLAAERIGADVRFFLERHLPFCMAVRV